MMVTVRLGYGCAETAAATTGSPSKTSAAVKTRFFIGSSGLNPQGSLRPRPHRYYGQQEVGLFAGAKVQGIPAGEYHGRAIVRVDVEEGADALHRVGRIG